MAKRVAGKQLTDQNWEDEEEPEEAGVFKVAADEIMKDRKVIKARRKVGDGESGGGETTGAFKGFAGFSAKPSTGPAAMFNFGSGTNKPLSSLSNGSGTKTTPFQLDVTKKSSESTAKDSSSDKKTVTNGFDKTEVKTSNSKYPQQLKALNEGVTKWIKEHVDKNPYCILTPIFKDYEKYLADIEKHNPDKGKTTEKTNQPSENKTEEVNNDKKDTKEDKKAESTSTSTFSFGAAVTSTTSSSTFGSTASTGSSLFSFGGSSSVVTTASSVFGGATAGATGFSFASSGSSSTVKPFSFASGSSKTDSGSNAASTAEEEEEYVPPVADVSEVKEDDAIYTKRCKLYYQNDGTWIEKGVGNLHLKPCNGKTQLLVRADTSLGNILLNIMLSNQIPFKRQGKNNVSLMCIANPPIDTKMDENKPVSMLLRVKTGEDADELLAKINENKS